MTIFQPASPGGAEFPADPGRQPPEPIRIETRPDRDRVIVAPHGDLDMATVDRLGACIDGLVDAGFETIVLDLRGLTFLDSTGLCLIVEEARRTDASLYLVDGTELVSRLFDLTGLRETLSFLDAHELDLRG